MEIMRRLECGCAVCWDSPNGKTVMDYCQAHLEMRRFDDMDNRLFKRPFWDMY